MYIGRMLEGGRVVAVFFLVFLLTETGVQILGQLSGWCSTQDAGQPVMMEHQVQVMIINIGHTYRE